MPCVSVITVCLAARGADAELHPLTNNFSSECHTHHITYLYFNRSSFQRFSEIAVKSVENKLQLAVMTDCLETLLKKLALSKHVRETIY